MRGHPHAQQGKTEVVIQHLKAGLEGKEGFKALFLAPATPLVDQQAGAFFFV